jgi:anhydro-N-acetylmuramic acid kinase
MSFTSSFRIIGLMSGTSLDGLDLVDVVLHRVNAKSWEFELKGFTLLAYTETMQRQLKSAPVMSALDLQQFSHKLGCYFADCVNNYLNDNKISATEIDAISSHGHTVFHQPQLGFTLQIANGPEIAVRTGIKTVCDFRTKDLALGGNGAPLVPIGDHLLFNDYACSFLNLGGFSNISFRNGREEIIAFDICPVNVVLNKIAQAYNLPYDDNGALGKTGAIQPLLLDRLNKLDYYEQEFPKSLGIEWVEQNIFPFLTTDVDFLRTFYEHIAIQIAQVLNQHELGSVLVTGGGARNSFLIELLQQHYPGQVIIPEGTITELKEAIVFALLGALRLNNEENVLASVTGARTNSCSGVIHTPL